MSTNALSPVRSLSVAAALTLLPCVAVSAEDDGQSTPSYISISIASGTTVFPAAINDSLTIGGWFVDAKGQHGFVREANGTIGSFDVAGNASVTVTGMNSEGEITGYYFATGTYHGFVRDRQGAITSFDVPGSVSTSASGINDNGTITGQYVAGLALHSFLRDRQGNFTPVDDPQGILTSAHAINHAGEVIGTYQDTSFNGHGFVRSPQGTYTNFDPPQSISTLPFGINAQGAITGYYYTVLGPVQTPNHGFARTPQGTITTFDVPGSNQTFPVAINNSGAITGQYVVVAFTQHGFVRDRNGEIVPFDFPGSTTTVPTAINNHGAIVGWYSPDGVATLGFVRLSAADGESEGKDQRAARYALLDAATIEEWEPGGPLPGRSAHRRRVRGMRAAYSQAVAKELILAPARHGLWTISPLFALQDQGRPRDNGLMPPEVIAERRYYLEENPTSPVILLQLFRPDQSENDYPRCLIRMLIDGRVEENEVSGVDFIDCIAMALIMAGTKIAGLNEAVYHNKLRWEGSSVDGDIGLPTIENSPLTKESYAEAERWALKEKSRGQNSPDG